MMLPHQDDDVSAMARRSYGYGHWDAPYWFIGPEQGMGEHEQNNLEQSLRVRARAWKELGCSELIDCRKFHCLIGLRRLHCSEPVALQPTWRPLMLLMMSFLERPSDNQSLRYYQARRWGSCEPWAKEAGETCVIELSGLAAPNLAENIDTGTFLNERIGVISDRLRDNPPRLVVMYGRMQMDSWNSVATGLSGRQFPVEDFAPDLPNTNVLRHGPTILVCTPAPSRPVKVGERYLVNEYWTRLGQRLQALNKPH
jgi:hypothetical protein